MIENAAVPAGSPTIPTAPDPRVFARPAVRAIEPYAWEESSDVLAARYGLDRAAVLRFDTNTSPFPPAGLDVVLEQVRREPYVNEYFDAAYTTLTQALARYAGQSLAAALDVQQVIVGAGADEVLDIIARTFLDNGDRVVTLTPTYSMYRIGAESMGATTTRAPYGPAPEFALPVDDLLDAAQGAKLLYVCAPNNPTGKMPHPGELTNLILRAPCMVVVDEAYHEFCGQTVAGLLPRAPHLLVVRTLSKAFSLAGGRLGYGLAAPETIALLNRVRPPNSVTYITAMLAEEGLRRVDEMRQRVAALAVEKANLSSALTKLGLQPSTSSTNFLLIPWRDEETAARVHQALLAQGLVVRRFDGNPIMARYLRVTVRTPDQNALLITALRTLRSTSW